MLLGCSTPDATRLEAVRVRHAAAFAPPMRDRPFAASPSCYEAADARLDEERHVTSTGASRARSRP